MNSKSSRRGAAGNKTPPKQQLKPRPTPMQSIADAAPKLSALEPAAARWIAAMIRMASPHPAMGYVLDVLGRLQDRPYRTNILVTGEPGTGKGGLARALTNLIAPHGRTVRVDLGGFSEQEALARLCGAGSQAGLVEAANEGALLIEEATDLSPRLQNELLRILKTGRVTRLGGVTETPVRLCVVTLSDRDLAAEVAAQRFRHDLYYRLARIVLWLPPLRERLEDVAATTVWMGNRILSDVGVPLVLRGAEDMKRASPEEQRRSIELTEAALETLRRHTWPGNFRELEAAVERALLLYRTDRRLGVDEIKQAMLEVQTSV